MLGAMDQNSLIPTKVLVNGGKYLSMEDSQLTE
jgi:hypothetical protein